MVPAMRIATIKDTAVARRCEPIREIIKMRAPTSRPAQPNAWQRCEIQR